MKSSDSKQYIKFVLVHLLIGLLIYLLPFFSKIYAISIIAVGYRYILLRKNVNNEALYVAAYIVGAEVLLRMTQGNFFEQYAKYGVMGALLLGMFFKGFSKNAIVYWIFGLLLLPGIILSFHTLNFETDIRKAITFNIIGPITLTFAAIYCYQRKVSFQQLKIILDMLAYPLMATLV